MAIEGHAIDSLELTTAGPPLASRPTFQRSGGSLLGFLAFAVLAATSGATAVLVLHHLIDRAYPGAELSSVAGPGEVVAPATAVSLARCALLRLDDANRTGNYAVFRDAASPAFQSINTATGLGGIFGWLREQRISLAGAALLEPGDLGRPDMEPGGILHLRGTLAAEPEAVSFDLLFQKITGEWRLFGIAVYRETT